MISSISSPATGHHQPRSPTKLEAMVATHKQKPSSFRKTGFAIAWNVLALVPNPDCVCGVVLCVCVCADAGILDTLSVSRCNRCWAIMDSSAHHIPSQFGSPPDFLQAVRQSMHRVSARTGTSTFSPTAATVVSQAARYLFAENAPSSFLLAQLLASSRHMMHFYAALLREANRTVGRGRRTRSWHVFQVINGDGASRNLARAARLPRGDATAEQLLAEA